MDMKKIITIAAILIIYISGAHAQKEIELVFGGITHHILHSKAPEYVTKDINRTLVTKMVGLRLTNLNQNKYTHYSVFTTDNCIGLQRYGVTFGYGLRMTRNNFELRFGGIIGGYNENSQDWIDKGYLRKIKTLGPIMPILGIEFSARYNYNKFGIGINTTISIITNTSIGISCRF